MLFNSYVFIFGFLPLALLVFFWLGQRRPQWAMPWLAAASCGFYAWWDWRFLPLLLASIVMNFWFGAKIAAGLPRPRKWWLAGAVAANLLVLCYYKYFYFLAGAMGAQITPPPDWVLPLGISFFTFTQITYLADVAAGQAQERKFWHYALFVSYFPHLIAGPILHHKQMMPQFASNDALRLKPDNVALGLTVFSIGLAKKVLLADTLAAYASPVFAAAAAGGAPGLVEAWTAALAYTLQLYFDFSGYSDMAVGLSLLFNIRLPQNFHSPYRAASIIDFWKRWHMTLSAFLRDYLYIPLGGNRRGQIRRYANLMITMVLGGLWHGAGWTFLAWGALHGAYLMINHAWQTLTRGTIIETLSANMLVKVAYIAVTFLCVVAGWVIFRAETMSTAMVMLQGMAGYNEVVLPLKLAPVLSPLALSIEFGDAAALTQLPLLQAWAMIAAGLAIVWIFPNVYQWLHAFSLCAPSTTTAWPLSLQELSWQARPWQAWLAGALFGLSLLSLTRVSEFLYFQF